MSQKNNPRPLVTEAEAPDELTDAVDLYTMDGRYVITGRIFRVAPSAPRFQLILWGTRTFVWDAIHQQYRETVGTAVLRATIRVDTERG